MTVTWSATDVPTVDSNDLLLAARIWLAERGRGHLTVAAVNGQRVDPITSLERRIADAYGMDTERSLAIILRLRCLITAFSCRRFRSELDGGDEAWLWRAGAAAARMRVNATIGFSPVRLAWAIAADERAAAAPATETLVA